MGSRPGTAAGGGQAEFTRRDVLVPVSSSSSSSSSSSHKVAPVSALAWSSNGKRLAAAQQDGSVKVWSIELSGTRVTERLECEFSHSSKGSEFVTALVFHPKRDDVLAVVGGHATKLVDLRPKSSSVSILAEAATKDGISASWDGHDVLLVAQRCNLFTKVDLRRKRPTKSAHLSLGEGDEVRDVAFIDRGSKVLISTTYGVEVRSWPGFEPLTVLQGHARHLGSASGVTALATTREEDCKAGGKPFTRLLATGGGDAIICLWDLQSAVPCLVISHPNERLRGLSFSSDQALLAYTVGEAPGYTNIELMNVATGEHMLSVPLSRGSEVVAFCPRYPRLLALAEPGLYSRDSKGKDAAALVSLISLK